MEMSKAYGAYVLHDGMLMGESFNGYTLSDEAKELVRQMLPGTLVSYNLTPLWRGDRLEDAIGQVRLVDGQLVIYFETPLDEAVAANLRPALSMVVESDQLSPDGPQVVTKILAVTAVALVPKHEGDMGYLEPYPKLVQGTETAVEETTVEEDGRE